MSKEQRIEQTAEWLEDLNEEQLQKILRSELQSEPMDVALIKRVNAVLATKSKESGSDETEAAWQRFLGDHADCEPIYDEVDLPSDDAPKRGRRASIWKKPMMRTAAAAAIVILLLGGTTLSARAAGFDLWGAVATWVSETFGFVQNDTIKITSIPEQLKELELIFKEHNFETVDLLPTYLPEGYEAVSTICSEKDYWTTYICELYNAEDEHIVLQYREYAEKKAMNAFQKSDPDVDVYTVGGVDHFVTINGDYYAALWVNGTMEGYLSVPNSRKELTKIIDSIYGE